MKKLLKFLTLAGFIFIMSSSHSLPKATTYSLTVKVEGLRNSKGVVQFALYNKKGTIPDEKFENYYRIKTCEIDNNSASVTFSQLPEGRYAINILHDENENGKIDKKFLPPLPKEGIGFSNYESLGLKNRPNFSMASFLVTQNSTKKVKIIYL
ncbi:DUF2141 domain-containing protein [Salegentibacter salegens]|uniref:Uncharacterized conserved protein, DUF2141 family n=1 Tax=Salegentibacter salegens TaxID=143223 RepID=A0A1M7KV19_9FLAO|nr:DUF2141 domain-containing protein [Salegentibacter salegens]PRX43820.1 uncharacterized protein (DUF2141 family) [Salegentibacter salegens]SHM69318.1 Uncharacterized conserved protein, DUF2141 family [Salegentibacter salegens]